jgi:hypothetical protein
VHQVGSTILIYYDARPTNHKPSDGKAGGRGAENTTISITRWASNYDPMVIQSAAWSPSSLRDQQNINLYACFMPGHLPFFVKYLQRSKNIEHVFPVRVSCKVVYCTDTVELSWNTLHWGWWWLSLTQVVECLYIPHKVFVRFPLQKLQLKRSYWYRPSEISRAMVRRLNAYILWQRNPDELSPASPRRHWTISATFKIRFQHQETNKFPESCFKLPLISPYTSYIRTARFWVIVQRVMVISYRNFKRTYRSHLQRSRF